MPPIHACFIIPPSALERLSHDLDLSAEDRESLRSTLRMDATLRQLRAASMRLAQLSGPVPLRLTQAIAAGPPDVRMFDCQHHTALPGVAVSHPDSASDATVRSIFGVTTKVAAFYKSVFGRDSVDNANMALLSSAHYGDEYNNAFWNGSQMVYGDGDGRLFLPFSGGIDVIGHELTHGVTQYTLQLDYEDEAGGLNESFSDVIGSMFRQWELGQTVDEADWLIGPEIIGPSARAKGFTCLRDMADPAGSHCLAPQPTEYDQIKPGMDPHLTSGPPNLAFATACKQAGGHSWETIGKVWYDVLTTSGPRPHLGLAEFAQLTHQSARQLFPDQSSVVAAVDAGWAQVGLK